MRILTWNLQHGGGSRVRRIAEALEPKEADVIVLSEYLQQKTLLIGDFNTGRFHEDEAGATFACSDRFEALLGQGWVDTWRSRNPEAREFSWYSRGWNNGFRLDQALASPSLDAQIKAVSYSHPEREAGISDHSMMIVDVNG